MSVFLIKSGWKYICITSGTRFQIQKYEWVEEGKCSYIKSIVVTSAHLLYVLFIYHYIFKLSVHCLFFIIWFMEWVSVSCCINNTIWLCYYYQLWWFHCWVGTTKKIHLLLFHKDFYYYWLILFFIIIYDHDLWMIM